MQDDALLANLTPRETLHYALRLRVPDSKLDQTQRDRRVSELLSELNLNKVADTRVCFLLHQTIRSSDHQIIKKRMQRHEIVFLSFSHISPFSHNQNRSDRHSREVSLVEREGDLRSDQRW